MGYRVCCGHGTSVRTAIQSNSSLRSCTRQMDCWPCSFCVPFVAFFAGDGTTGLRCITPMRNESTTVSNAHERLLLPDASVQGWNFAPRPALNELSLKSCDVHMQDQACMNILVRKLTQLLAPCVHRSAMPYWLAHPGALGLFSVAVIDSSVIPLPVPGRAQTCFWFG